MLDPVRKFLTSRLTSKAQTTIPQAVRTALGLKTGDELAYVEDGRAILLRYVPDQSVDESFATFSEWNSKADFRAYGGL